MGKKSCTCKPKDVVPSRHFYAKGKVDIFMVFSLNSYLTQDTKDNLERLRGGRGFANAMKELKPVRYFAPDRDEEKILDSGHDFQVFRGHLIKDWFFPTFYFQKEQVEIPEDPQLKAALNKYEARVRLSRSGFLEIKLTRLTVKGKYGEPIIEVLRDLMELRSSSSENSDSRSTMLKLALFCADKFIENLPAELTIKEGDESLPLKLRVLGLNPETLPYRQRYVTLFLEEILCMHCWGRRIEADKLQTDYMGILAAIVEGVLVQDEKGVVNFPIIDEKAAKELKDLASWKNDLCIFAPERALIYFPPQKIFISGRDGTRGIDYKYYWECISRGIEHTVVIRAALQSIAYSTTEILESVPRLTERVVDGDISKDDEDHILNMAKSFSYSFKTLPFLRDILVPSSSYRASYAVNKFEYLNDVLHIKEVKDYVERNVDELVNFVQFFSSMEVQQELNLNQVAIDRASLIIAIVAFAATAPSFMKDYYDFVAETKTDTLGDFMIWLMGNPSTSPAFQFLLIVGLQLIVMQIWSVAKPWLKKRQAKLRRSRNTNN